MSEQYILPPMLPREAAIQRIVRKIGELPTDTGWRVEIHEHKATRSHQQNAYLWGGIYPAILKAGGNALAGWTEDDLHEYVLGECFGWETVTGFGKKRMRPKRRSSKLSKTEFMGFVDFIHRTMAGHGIFIPDPDPDYWKRAA